MSDDAVRRLARCGPPVELADALAPLLGEKPSAAKLTWYLAEPLPEPVEEAGDAGARMLELAARLAHPECDTRRRAVVALGRLLAGQTRVAEPVLLALEAAALEPDPILRAAALDARVQRPEERARALALIRTLLGHPDAPVRALAVKLAVPLGVGALPALVGMSSDPAPRVRLELASTLGCIRPTSPAAVAVLAEMLHPDGDPELRAEALAALASLGPTARDAMPAICEAAVGAGRRARLELLATVAAMGPAGHRAAPLAERAIRHADPAIRMAGARALAAIGSAGPGTVTELILLTEDPRPPVRCAAVQALGAIAPAAGRGLKAVERRIRDQNWSVTACAEAALRRLGPREGAQIPELDRQLDALAGEHSAEDALRLHLDLARVGPAARLLVPRVLPHLMDAACWLLADHALYHVDPTLDELAPGVAWEADAPELGELSPAVARFDPRAAGLVGLLVGGLADPARRPGCAFALGRMGDVALPALEALRALRCPSATLALAGLLGGEREVPISVEVVRGWCKAPQRTTAPVRLRIDLRSS